MKKHIGDLIPLIIIIVTLIISIGGAYLIAISDLPDWFKFYLLFK